MVPVVLGSERKAWCVVQAVGLGCELSLAISSDPGFLQTSCVASWMHQTSDLLWRVLLVRRLLFVVMWDGAPTSFPKVIYCYKEPTASTAVDLHRFV